MLYYSQTDIGIHLWEGLLDHVGSKDREGNFWFQNLQARGPSGGLLTRKRFRPSAVVSLTAKHVIIFTRDILLI